MDDIICPECGRPNLGEAKKCWYCQTELKFFQPEPANTSVESIPTKPMDAYSDDQVETDFVVEEDIPEWLKRVRERIEADRDPEEEIPYWKQKDIFGSEKKAKSKTRKNKKAKSINRPKKNKANQAHKKQENPTPLTEANVIPENKPMETDSDKVIDTLSEDLPDGFTKL